ncbi:unnamed protein product, partial [Mesorhabditis belari]|uniref:Cytochrome c oxidase assembly factor 3 n=1 Tax=Mesorhabditis belari TaxID=2138241 RepID=A0AAF3F426_9BILA
MLGRQAALRARIVYCRWKSSAASSSEGSSDTPQLGPKSSQALRTYQSKDPDMLETVKFEDLPRAQQRFVKQFEKINEERIKDIFKKNYKNIIGMVVLIGVVVSIYYYTMYAVRQETFLEEIDEEMAQEHPKTHGHLATANEKKN